MFIYTNFCLYQSANCQLVNSSYLENTLQYSFLNFRITYAKGIDYRLGKLQCNFWPGISFIFSYCSSWLVVIVTLDRLTHVTKPLKSFSTIKNTKKIIICILFTSFLVNFHYFGGLKVNEAGMSYYEMCVGRNAYIQLYYTFHVKWLDGLLYSILPSCLILTSNCLILWNLWRKIRQATPISVLPNISGESSSTLQVPIELRRYFVRKPAQNSTVPTVNQPRASTFFCGQLSIKKRIDQTTVMSLLLPFTFAGLTLPVTIVVYKLSAVEDDLLLIAKFSFRAQVRHELL